MVLKRLNNIILILIILLSTSFYSLSFLGPLQKVFELAGAGLILFLLMVHMVYDKPTPIKHNYIFPILLIVLSLITSMIMASYSRDQEFMKTLYSQRAMYFYLLYFLLHFLKIKPRDLEIILLSFGIIYVLLFITQYVLYPKIIFDAYVRLERGTIRIYLAGSGFLAVAIYMCAQFFFRTNNLKYLLLLFLFLLIIVFSGGRTGIAIIIFTLTLFLIFDKKIKSRLFLMFLGLIACTMIYVIFQSIFDALISQSQFDLRVGQDYIRIKAAEYFLTDFFRNPIAYITGNGMFASHTAYGNEIESLMINNGFYLADIGIIGNYVLFGAFFLIAIFMIITKTLKLKFESRYVYLKFFFIDIILGLLTAGSFTQAHFIVLIACILYMVDASHHLYQINSEPNNKLSNIPIQ